ncbi:sodium/proton antiporter [Salmonella enterica subsp. enterica]|nr:sodium/proton antiporter [Salmonella enterica subsp. enterica]
MSASQNKKKTLSLGLALIPVISMLLLLIIGYGIMGATYRTAPSVLCGGSGRHCHGGKDTVGKTSSTQWWISWLKQCRLS